MSTLLKTATIVSALSLAACSAHSPFIIANTTDVRPSGKIFAPHSNQIFVTSGTLPPSANIEVVGELDVGSNWYGSDDKAYGMLAAKARELGADAVIRVNVWRQPSGFSWAAPHAKGTAVKVSNLKALDLGSVAGQWR